jgi:hypothetical protein
VKKLVVIGILLSVVVVLFAPIKPLSDRRNDMAYEAMLDGREGFAKTIYFLSMLEGDTRAANNWHVLRYRAARDRTQKNRDARHAANARYRTIFDQLSAKGLAVATYNRGLFTFRCVTRQNCYEQGKAYFTAAQEQGDPLAQGAYALHLTHKSGHPDAARRETLLKQAADNGDLDAAFYYSHLLVGTNKKISEKYAGLALASGKSHALEHAGTFFRRADSLALLEKAARHKENPRISAARYLGYLYRTGDWGGKVDPEKAQYWYEFAIDQSFAYRSPLIIRRDGLRWRGVSRGYVTKTKTSRALATYELANMVYVGKTDADSKAKFKHYMQIAAEQGVHDSKRVFARLP